MLLLSWPLWVETGAFPRVPFLPALPQATGAVSWGVFAPLVGAVVMSGLSRAWRGWFGLAVGLFVALVGQDQHRFQPWVYQYLMTLLLLAGLPGAEGLRYVRWWFIALYVHSGLSKLDVSFCDEMGPLLLRAALGPLGIDPTAWAGPWRVAAVLAMPAAEIAVAVALAVPGMRKVGRLGAAALHLALIEILGPVGLGHSAIVLAWNAAMLVEVWVAFGPEIAGEAASTWRTLPVKGVFWAGVVLPLGERWGVFDAWPSHALYASHGERVSVLLHRSALGRYPAEVRGQVREVGEGPWLLLDLTGWSRAVRGTPVYPQNRACLGLAEALAARYGGPLPVRVIAFGPADRWTGRRRREEASGLGEIRRLGDRYRLNAHPAVGPDPERGSQPAGP
jgi:hypothetical protein